MVVKQSQPRIKYSVQKVRGRPATVVTTRTTLTPRDGAGGERAAAAKSIDEIVSVYVSMTIINTVVLFVYSNDVFLF